MSLNSVCTVRYDNEDARVISKTMNFNRVANIFIICCLAIRYLLHTVVPKKGTFGKLIFRFLSKQKARRSDRPIFHRKKIHGYLL